MIGIFIRIGIGLLLNFLGALLAPNPKPPEAGTESDFGVPVTREGIAAGVIMGTAWIDDPHVVDSGDFQAVPIRKKGGKK